MTPDDMSGWAQLIASIGVPAALLVWLIVYRDPKQAEVHQATAKQQRDDFANCLKQTCDSHERVVDRVCLESREGTKRALDQHREEMEKILGTLVLCKYTPEAARRGRE